VTVKGLNVSGVSGHNRRRKVSVRVFVLGSFVTRKSGSVQFEFGSVQCPRAILVRFRSDSFRFVSFCARRQIRVRFRSDGSSSVSSSGSWRKPKKESLR
jgi:hypothetical protein